MANTLFLLPDTWDLTLDSSGNIAIASDVYQQAQDIASACRVFRGDMYFNKNDGIPYSESILGKSSYPLGLYQSELRQAALSVDGVISANITFNKIENRVLTGMIKFTNDQDQTGVVSL